MDEQELKISINEAQYNDILNNFLWDSNIQQINFYYMDSETILLKKRITVRVRLIQNAFFLQIKLPVSENGGIHVKQEFTKMLNYLPYKIESAFFQKIISEKFPNVTLQGFLITERRHIHLGNKIILFLDRNSYLGNIDYEVEFEFEDIITLENLINDKFSKYNFNKNISVVGKSGRFFTKLFEQNI